MLTASRAGLLALALCGCKGTATSEDGGDDSNPTAPPPEVTKLDPATLGSISGVVSVTGTLPEPKELPMGAEPACASQYEGPALDAAVVASEGKLQNVFVHIAKGLEGKTFATPTDEVVIDQKGCLYEPRVRGVQVRQPLTFVNSDPALHNIHTVGENNRDHNFGMPTKGMRTTKTFKKPEVMVTTKCDVHPWMRAFVGVVDHPFFAVSGADGAFKLEGVPPGEYTVEAWHEVFGIQTATVTLEPSGAQTIELSFVAG